MKRFLLTFCCFVSISFIITSNAKGGGFQINEHGAKAMGMGGAFTAQANDPSAIFFNPAGLGFQQGMNLMLGTTLIFPSNKFIGPSPATTESKMKSQIFYPINIYGTYSLNDAITFGLGVYNPFGLGTEWDKDWVGKRLSIKTDLQTFFINPTVAYRVNEQLSLGFGVSYVLANVNMKFRLQTFSSLQPLTPATVDGTAELDADGNGFNFNVGLLYKPIEDLSLGLSYRHSTKLSLEGNAVFTDMQALQTYFPGGEGKTTITLPYNILFGVAYNFLPELTIEAGFQYVGWKLYDTLDIKIAEGPPAPLLGVLQKGSRSPKDWENAFLLRLGGEYRFGEFALRAGYIFDKTPQPDKSVEPMLPDADRHELTLGLGYKLSENLDLNFAYQIILFNDRTVVSPTNTFPGTYKSKAHLFGINIGYKF